VVRADNLASVLGSLRALHSETSGTPLQKASTDPGSPLTFQMRIHPNLKPVLCLALILSGALFGCSTPHHLVAIDPNKEPILDLPLKFASYQKLYAFIAKREGLPTDAHTVFKLAADSSTQIYGLNGPPLHALVITPHFYNGGIFDTIRGAQGNGSLYIARSLAHDFTSLDTDHGFELIGFGAGNGLLWSSVNERCRFITGWHLSAGERPETTYERPFF